MTSLLIRCYPARWRDRYGEEFAAVLAERTLGPFDVADIVLGALDAHLHLRGLGAASHGKGFAMSLRIGGYAAILGGLLWLVALAGNAINNGGESPSPLLGYSIVGATVMTLVALMGLSAFQARSHPALTWAAFAIPAMAFAQEAAAAGATPAAVSPNVAIAKAVAAAVTMAIAAMSAGYAQARIGAAAAGTLAERPEAGTNLIVITALTEIIVLMGFVIAFMINAA